jgi:hypothetical protein
MQGYDIIGDIHGHADALCRLLEKLGYRKSNGVYRHPSRTVIYLGDFIDRGPQQMDVINIARSMCEAGAALAVMGNHEFNALAWATPRGDGTYLRPHTADNRRQHEAFLDQVGEGSTAYHDALDWFRSLPLWLDLPGLRLVHACWHAPSQRILEEKGAVDSNQRLTDVGLQMTAERGSEEFKAAEILLKGPEIKLPDGLSFEDRSGIRRTKARLRWWDRSAPTFRNAVLSMEGREYELPDAPVVHDYHYVEAVPMFFGHYWLRDEPILTNSLTACLDYSVADNGYLTSYRWTGEETLAAENLVWEAADCEMLGGTDIIERTAGRRAEERLDMERLPNTKRFKVMVYDNFHVMDESERYELAEFDTLEEAISACQRHVDSDLEWLIKPTDSAEDLYKRYTGFGEDPFIVATAPTDEKIAFSAWDYAKERSVLMVSTQGGDLNGDEEHIPPLMQGLDRGELD